MRGPYGPQGEGEEEGSNCSSQDVDSRALSGMPEREALRPAALRLTGDALEVAGVVGAFEAVRQSEKLVGVDETLAKSDLLDAGDLEALAAFHDMDELRGLEQGIVGARIEPGEA